MSEDAVDQESKTEEPTDKRRSQFRDQGQIAYSREIGSTLAFISILLTFYWLSTMLFDGIRNLFSFTFGNLAPWTQRTVPFASHIAPQLKPLVIFMSTVMLVAFVAPLIAHTLQKGIEPMYEAATPSFTKLNPLKGLMGILSKDTLIRTLLNLLRTAGMMIIFYLTIKPFISRIIFAAQMPFQNAMTIFISMFAALLKNAVLFLVGLAAMDYIIKFRSIHNKMMMSRQELKDESKESEGNPEVKSKIRQIQRERSKRRANKEVPKATVVITNPTHFAIAVKYVRGEMMVPRVVSKGSDSLALKIRELAKEHHVPIVENPPLARALYRDVKEGGEIPNKYFKPVAKIIAAIMRLEQEKKMQRLAALAPSYGEATR